LFTIHSQTAPAAFCTVAHTAVQMSWNQVVLVAIRTMTPMSSTTAAMIRPIGLAVMAALSSHCTAAHALVAADAAVVATLFATRAAVSLMVDRDRESVATLNRIDAPSAASIAVAVRFRASAAGPNPAASSAPDRAESPVAVSPDLPPRSSMRSAVLEAARPASSSPFVAALASATMSTVRTAVFPATSSPALRLGLHLVLNVLQDLQDGEHHLGFLLPPRPWVRVGGDCYLC
jgi:hypothetical protein